MVSLEYITLHYGERILFDDISCLIGPHDRIGLVGSNGTGKTTLLKIIAGLERADSGKVEKAKIVTVGYLPQDGISTKGRTLYDEAETAFEHILKIQDDLKDVHESLSTLDPASPSYNEAVEIMGELQHKLEDLDVYRMKGKIERVLMGLGFSVDDFRRQTAEFSGGWQMRIALGKLLLQEPSLLLLDEPTNHLDLDTLQWLEGYLQEYNGGIILVSHDRAFLDNLCRRTFSLSRGTLQEYAGNYSFYEEEKEVRKTLVSNAQKNQEQQLKQAQQFIDRFRYKASKARQVQSRIKQLEKIERIELENEEDKIRFRFPQPAASGRVVLELKSVVKSYGNTKVFHGLHCKIERGDKIAIVGVNGAGKSTFSRISAGTEPVDRGERILGHNVTVTYFAQDQAEELDPAKQVIEILDEAAEGEIRKKLRTILGSFLFHGDDVFKKVSVLSGGEKGRVALARMLVQPSNFLILDEPTNHLDMQSKKILQAALQHFAGTIVIVSHDREFLEPIVNKVMEFMPGRVKTHLGTLGEFLQRKYAEAKSASERSGFSSSFQKHASDNHARPNRELKEIAPPQGENRKTLKRKLQSLRKRVEELEREVRGLETEKDNFEMMLADPELYKRGGEAKEMAQKYKEVQCLLELKYDEWTLKNDEITKMQNSGTAAR